LRRRKGGGKKKRSSHSLSSSRITREKGKGRREGGIRDLF